MVYSTCTIFDEENFDVIKAFLANHQDFEQVTISHEKNDIITDGCIFLTPEMYHTDGFFVAKFRKKLELNYLNEKRVVLKQCVLVVFLPLNLL